jgi:predicted amidophosphoribosyltransferase
MENQNKRYCSGCGERVRHSTRRCPFCRSLILNWRHVLTYVLISVVTVTALFLLLDYLNIEIFK